MKDSRDAHFEVSLREFDLFSTMENLVLHFYDYRVGGKTIKFEEFITSIVKYVSFLFTRSYIYRSCKSKQIVPYNFTFLLTILLLMN